MDRRKFMGMLGGLVLGQAVPLGRVWSFPKEIKLWKPELRKEDFETFLRAQYPSMYTETLSANHLQVGDTIELYPGFLIKGFDSEFSGLKREPYRGQMVITSVDTEKNIITYDSTP